MLICSMGVSVDGFIADHDGAFVWTAPIDELFRFHSRRSPSAATICAVRRLYETMLLWETDASLRDTEAGATFADVWCALPKVVVSRTLDKDLSIGGAGLAATAFELGLVDELRMFRRGLLATTAQPGSHSRTACRRGSETA